MQRSYLEQALKLAPRDDRVRLALWQVHSDLGDHTEALDVAVGGAGDEPAFARRRGILPRCRRSS